MSLHKTLARSFTAAFPGEVAAELESRASDEVAAAVSELPPGVTAHVLERMTPVAAARVVEQLEAEYASSMFPRLTFDSALSLLRQVAPEGREAILASLPLEHANAMRAAISFPAGTAGALMDPRLLSVHADLSVDDAIKVLRRASAYTGYNLYVIDRNQVLVGVLNLHELMRANGKATLDSIMNSPEHRLDADADRLAIVNHPGWRQVHSLPVVDSKGLLLGAIRYRTFRRLEEQVRHGEEESAGITAQALGDLFATGLGGLLDAIATSVAPRRSAVSNPAESIGPREERQGVDDG